MPQSPEQQRAIVQRMIDAGESEENIATVIQHFKTTGPKAPEGSAVGRFLGGVWDAVNPLPMAQRAFDIATSDNPAAGIAATGMQILSPLARLKNVKDQYQKGGATGAANEIAASIPLIGPASEHASQRMKSGDVAGGLGEVTGLIGSAAAPEVAASALGKVGRAIPRAMKNPNPVEASALEYVQSRGVPVDAGTMTGNKAVQGAKYLADRTVGGSVVAGQAAQQEAKGLATLGEQLAAKAAPKAETPLSAGEAVREAASKRISDLHAEASKNYQELRKLEAQNVQRVITGTAPSKSGLVRAMSVTEDMGFPVQLRPVKQALKPVLERIERQMPIAQQQASAGFKALQNIVNGPDLAPASVVDADLSAIKTIARGADRPELRDVSQGLAAAAVKQLDEAVQKAVSQGGTDATRALQQGRQATKAKYLTAEILDALNREPVRAYRQATAAKDAAITQLRELQAIAPKEVPKLGRAFLDDMLTTATSEGGFKGAQKMAADWERLGPQTKKILFAQPGLVPELDKFFLAAKRLSENPNPSGSGGIVSIGTQGYLLLTHPLLGGAMQLGGAALAKVLRSPHATRMLTEGMRSRSPLTAVALRQALNLAVKQKDGDQ